MPRVQLPRRRQVLLFGLSVAVGAFLSGPGRGRAEERPRTVEDHFNDWLKQEGLSLGVTRREDRIIIVSRGTSPVKADAGSSRWANARILAFAGAELDAKRQVANFIRAEIDSGRSLATDQTPEEEVPPGVQKEQARLSNVDKLQILTGAKLDAAIREHDPNWGVAPSEESRKAEAVKIQQTIRESIKLRADVFTSGASTVAQFEGADADGTYTVLVAMIWSNRMQRLAENVWNPQLQADEGKPGKPLDAQFEELSREDPAWPAFTNGVRVFTNERGEKVVVGFGMAPTTPLAATDRNRAFGAGLAAIQRFVAERVVANSDDNAASTYQQLADQRERSFDLSKFQERIEATSRKMQIQGAAIALDWRDQHPNGRVRMQVVGVAWTPSGSFEAAAAEKALSNTEERMRRQGAVPQSGDGRGAGPAAPLPVRAGARTNSQDF